ncbi:hypothetical protein GA0070216_114177 [Micromonospora matsumotoense]|uniref:Uncharacterized protein n=1 Tax=Micromonospora matsumotoense TaxID=121616 RepID=A0A1C5A959_9ACTN|nr:hypothetical protein GA0070216_114177 [Micromonospora matsumotoense]
MIVTFCDRRDRIVRLSATRPSQTGFLRVRIRTDDEMADPCQSGCHG